MRVTLWESDLKLIVAAVRDISVNTKIETVLARSSKSSSVERAPEKYSLELSDTESKVIVDALSDEFALRGVDNAGEPNALGLKIESIIDSVYRYEELN